MKQKFLPIIALLLMAATGAWAQGSEKKIYSVDFSSDYTSYQFYNENELAKVENGLLVLTNSKVYTQKYDVQPEIGRPTAITAGKCYRIAIEYKSTVGGPVNVVLGALDWSTMMGAWWVPITVSDNFQTLEATFLKCNYGATDNHILFQFGDLVGTVYIKKVEVYEFDYVDVTSVTLSSSTATMTVDKKVALTATVAPDNATEKIVKWSVGGTNADAVKLYTDEACTTEVGSDATSALTVYAKGMSAGKATVKAESGADATKSATCTITVNPTFSATLAEGTEDADKWTIEPNTGLNGGETVTATYNGKKKVKSVKAVKKEVVKPDLLSGVFSVSSTKKVNFSKGNLQATYDGSSWTWAFANNQWDYIGNAAGNTKVTDASPFISENGTVDLFGWVGASSTWDGVNQYGITSSNARNATNGYGNSATENLKNDWGTLMGTGWHTLTKDEWAYVVNTRSGSTIGTTANARFAKAKVNDVMGVILFPDTYTHPDGVTAPTGVNATGDTGWNGNSYTAADWTKMESAGCVFLPAAGSRDGNSVSSAGTAGTYWWSTHYEGGGDAVDRAYNLYFTNNYLLPTAGSYRDIGCSVRLVKDK